MKGRGGVGNMSNQIYEAQHHIARHLKVLDEAAATKETSRWREELINSTPIDDTKKLRKLHLKNLSLEHENEKLSERLHGILTECRKDATIEYQPGWRIGKGGTVIDCYASSKNDAERFASMHGRGVEEERQEKKQQAVNIKLYESIQRARSTYAVEDIRKDWEHHKRLAKVLDNKVSHTTLHLGLVKAARDKQRKKSLKESQQLQQQQQQQQEGGEGGTMLMTADSAVSAFATGNDRPHTSAGPVAASSSSMPLHYRGSHTNNSNHQHQQQPGGEGSRPMTVPHHHPSPHSVTIVAPTSASDDEVMMGVKRDRQLEIAARASEDAQWRLQQQYPESFVYASNMGDVIDLHQKKSITNTTGTSTNHRPFTSHQSPPHGTAVIHTGTGTGRTTTAPTSSSSTIFPSLLSPESLSNSIAAQLWDSFQRMEGSRQPDPLSAYIHDPLTHPSSAAGRPRTATRTGGMASSNSVTGHSITDAVDWSEGAINGGWEKSTTPIIRLGEKNQDRYDTWRNSTRNVFMRKFSAEANRPSTQSQAQDLNRPPEAATSHSNRPHTSGGIGHSPGQGQEHLHPYIRNILVQGNGRSTVKEVSSRSKGGSTLRRSIHHFLPLQPLDSADPRAVPLPRPSTTGGKSKAVNMVPWQPEIVNMNLINDNDSSAEGGVGGFGSVDAADSLMSDGFVAGGQGMDGEGSIGQLTAGTATNDHNGGMQRSYDGGGGSGSPVAKRAAGVVKKKGNTSASPGGSAVLQETSILSSARYQRQTSAMRRKDARIKKRQEAGWSSDFAGRQTRYDHSTVDVSVKGGRVRVAEGLFYPDVKAPDPLAPTRSSFVYRG